MENAFGILSQKFKIYQTALHSLPENVDNIILRLVFCIVI